MANPFDQFDQTEENPFSQFDASASTGNPFDAFDGKEAPTPKEKDVGIVGPNANKIPGTENWVPPEMPKDERSTFKKALDAYQGMHESGLTLATGALAGVAGVPVGIARSLMGGGKAKDEADAFAERNTYVPRSKFGQDILEKAAPVLEGMQALGPMDPFHGVGMAGRQISAARLAEARKVIATEAPKTTSGAVAAALAKKKAAEIPTVEVRGTRDSLPDSTNPVVTVTPEGEAIPPNIDLGTRLAMERQRQAEATNPATGQRELFAGDPRQTLIDQGPQPGINPAEPAPVNRRQMGLQLEGNPEILADSRGNARLNPGTPDEFAGMARQQILEQMDIARREGDAAKWARAEQALIDDTQHVLPDTGEVYGAQYGTGDGVGRVDENGMPIRADRSIEAQQLQNPLQRNLWGDELDPALGQNRSLTGALDALPEGPQRHHALELLGDVRTDEAVLRAAAEALNPDIPKAKPLGFNRRTKGQGGAVGWDLGKTGEPMGGLLGKAIAFAKSEAPMKWFTASPEAGRKMGYSLAEQSARPNAEGQRYGPGQYISASRDFSSVYGGPEGRMYTVDSPFSKPFDVNKASNEKIYQSLVEKTGSRAAANATLKRAGYDAITFSSPRGDKLANIFDSKPLQDIGPAREKIREQTLSIQEYEPGSNPMAQSGSRFGGKQGGWVAPFGNKHKQANVVRRGPLGDEFKNFRPIDKTPTEFIESQKNVPDVQQNMLQKAFNQFTKGGDYMVEKTGNQVIKYVVDQMRGADARAKGLINKFVHDDYAKKLRGLKNDELVKVWDALLQMQKAGTKLTDEELVNAGFSLKERDMIKTHQDMMDLMMPKIDQAMQDAGMGTFKPETAYLAAKAQGAFRKLIYKTVDGEKKVVGIVGAHTRRSLDKQVAKYAELHPEYEAGPELTFMGGSKGRMADGFEEMLRFLGDNDSAVAEFVQRSKELMDADVQNYRGAKTHTMDKKGIEGMAGDKPWEDAYTNAKEGFEAQVSYLNRMLEFGEKAAAVKNVKEVLASVDINQPNAKAYAKAYLDRALGRNPSVIGRLVNDGLAHLGKESGMGVAGGAWANAKAKALVNAKLLSTNLLYLYANLTDPIRNSPGVYAHMQALGIKTGPVGLGHNLMALLDQAKLGAGVEVKPLIKQAAEYARDNHVYASDLYEHSNSVRRSVGDAIMDGLQKPGAAIEGASRQNVFFSLVNMLGEKNGMKPSDGLFYAAHRATDMIMNSYNRMDAPAALDHLGSAGSIPYNLMSYKFNQLSQLSMLARDVKTQGAVKPILMTMAMQAGFGGLMGLIGYKEADWAVRKITEAMGEPTSLTKMLLDNADKKVEMPFLGDVTVGDAAYGAHNRVGGDMTNRMGMGYIAVDPEKPLASLAPGYGTLADTAEAAWDFAKDPQAYNGLKVIRNTLPNGLQGAFDRKFFSKTLPNGTEMGMNVNKAVAGVERNEADKKWKTVGGTGVNESRKKSLLFENQRIDKFYQEKQKQDVLQMSKSLFTDGAINPKYIKEFADHQGNLDNLNTTVETLAKNGSIPADKADIIKLAVQQGLPAAQKMKRRFH